jgi:hypothetical protein
MPTKAESSITHCLNYFVRKFTPCKFFSRYFNQSNPNGEITGRSQSGRDERGRRPKATSLGYSILVCRTRGLFDFNTNCSTKFIFHQIRVHLCDCKISEKVNFEGPIRSISIDLVDKYAKGQIWSFSQVMKKTPAFKQIFMPNFEGLNRRRLIGA